MLLQQLKLKFVQKMVKQLRSTLLMWRDFQQKMPLCLTLKLMERPLFQTLPLMSLSTHVCCNKVFFLKASWKRTFLYIFFIPFSAKKCLYYFFYFKIFLSYFFLNSSKYCLDFFFINFNYQRPLHKSVCNQTDWHARMPGTIAPWSCLTLLLKTIICI